MNIRNIILSLGICLAIAIPTSAFSADTPLLMAKDEAKCETCMKKLTAVCESENTRCTAKDGAAACQAYYEKCKTSVRSRCGGPSLCD